MIERRITAWKQECRMIADQLKPILTHTKLITNLDDHLRKSLSMAELPNDRFIEQEQPGNEEKLSENTLLEDHSISRIGVTSAPLSVNGDISLEELDQRSQEKELPLDETERSLLEGKDENIVKCSIEYLPSVVEMAPYEPLVSKLHQPQKVVVANEINKNINATKETITILGSKSFYDEGRIQTIRNRVRHDEEEIAKYSQEHEVKYDPSTSEYFFTIDHYVTREERKQMLKSGIKERRDMNMM